MTVSLLLVLHTRAEPKPGNQCDFLSALGWGPVRPLRSPQCREQAQGLWQAAEPVGASTAAATHSPWGYPRQLGRVFFSCPQLLIQASFQPRNHCT